MRNQFKKRRKLVSKKHQFYSFPVIMSKVAIMCEFVAVACFYDWSKTNPFCFCVGDDTMLL